MTKKTDRSHPKPVAEDTNFAHHATKNRRLEESKIMLINVAIKVPLTKKDWPGVNPFKNKEVTVAQ